MTLEIVFHLPGYGELGWKSELTNEGEYSCLKNSLGFVVRWDTRAAASCKPYKLIQPLTKRADQADLGKFTITTNYVCLSIIHNGAIYND